MISQQKLISIVVATYNAEKLVENTLKSIVAQKLDVVELIIIDGNSSDNTVEVINKFKEAIDYFISEKDSGIYDAWNKALKVARGKYITFLGAGDELLDNYIDSYISYVANNPQCDYISSRVQLSNNSNTSRIIGNIWSWSLFRRFMCVAHVGSWHLRELFDKYGEFNINYKIVGDYEFLLRIGSKLRAGYIDEITVRMLGGGVSATNYKVFAEVRMAKIINRSANKLEVVFDDIIAKTKFFIKNILAKFDK